ncbi:uncharacterized protein LOC141801109 [Halichoeres trimaculatus]|uniref:uncharacterized protein LOC141801109 n=1 Tax=Halichoeres trimaculatus TaxID=147232 RepID=UPI003D9EF6FC
MKIVLCLLFGIATMVATAPIRARRENVLNFLEHALDTATEKTIHAASTATKNPPRGPEKEQESADMSEAKSKEGFGTKEPTNTFTDPDSHEVIQKSLSQRRTGSLNRDSAGMTGVSGGPTQDLGSREHPGPVGSQQSSREQINLNSQEGLTVDAQDVVNLRGHQMTFRRKAAPRRLSGSNGLLTQGLSREVQDLDSLEENKGKPAATGNRGHPDIDETREMISSETNLVASPGHSLSGSPAPAKSRTS